MKSKKELKKEKVCEECLEQARLLGMSGSREFALRAKIDSLEKHIAVLENGLQDVKELIANSEGIAGFAHSNKVIYWSDFRKNGVFYGWFKNYDRAVEKIFC